MANGWTLFFCSSCSFFFDRKAQTNKNLHSKYFDQVHQTQILFIKKIDELCQQGKKQNQAESLVLLFNCMWHPEAVQSIVFVDSLILN